MITKTRQVLTCELVNKELKRLGKIERLDYKKMYFFCNSDTFIDCFVRVKTDNFNLSDWINLYNTMKG